MIRMSYSCACGMNTARLEEAQGHADETGHVVRIAGEVTTRIPQVDATAIEASARARATEAEILRAARDRGLLKRCSS